METPKSIQETIARRPAGARVFNHNLRLSGVELPGWEIFRSAITETGKNPGSHAYFWKRRGNGERQVIRVDIAESANWRVSIAQLASDLAQRMNPEPIQATDGQAVLGDIQFAYREQGTDIVAAILFNSGNLRVALSSIGETTVDVSEAAKLLDSLIDKPAEKAAKRSASGKASSQTTEVKPGSSIVLVENLFAGDFSAAWLKVVVPDGELDRVGSRLVYTPSEGGKKLIHTYLKAQG